MYSQSIPILTFYSNVIATLYYTLLYSTYITIFPNTNTQHY